MFPASPIEVLPQKLCGFLLRSRSATEIVWGKQGSEGLIDLIVGSSWEGNFAGEKDGHSIVGVSSIAP